MFCPKCGTQCPDGSAFCPSCGNKLGARQAVPAAHAVPKPHRASPLKAVGTPSVHVGGAGDLGRIVSSICSIAALGSLLFTPWLETSAEVKAAGNFGAGLGSALSSLSSSLGGSSYDSSVLSFQDSYSLFDAQNLFNTVAAYDSSSTDLEGGVFLGIVLVGAAVVALCILGYVLGKKRPSLMLGMGVVVVAGVCMATASIQGMSVTSMPYLAVALAVVAMVSAYVLSPQTK